MPVNSIANLRSGAEPQAGIASARRRLCLCATARRVLTLASRPDVKADPTQSTATAESPELSSGVRKGDATAIERTVRAYLGHVYRAARGAGLDPQQAEDVTQETFTTFIETAHRFEGRSRVRTWLFGILYRKIAEARRGIARDSRFEDIDQVFESRFDAAGAWSRPPRPAGAELGDKEIRRGILDCLVIIGQRRLIEQTLEMGEVPLAAERDEHGIYDTGLIQFEMNIRNFIEIVRNLGATPILVTQANLLHPANSEAEMRFRRTWNFFTIMFI